MRGTEFEFNAIVCSECCMFGMLHKELFDWNFCLVKKSPVCPNKSEHVIKLSQSQQRHLCYPFAVQDFVN